MDPPAIKKPRFSEAHPIPMDPGQSKIWNSEEFSSKVDAVLAEASTSYKNRSKQIELETLRIQNERKVLTKSTRLYEIQSRYFSASLRNCATTADAEKTLQGLSRDVKDQQLNLEQLKRDEEQCWKSLRERVDRVNRILDSMSLPHIASPPDMPDSEAEMRAEEAILEAVKGMCTAASI